MQNSSHIHVYILNDTKQEAQQTNTPSFYIRTKIQIINQYLQQTYILTSFFKKLFVFCPQNRLFVPLIRLSIYQNNISLSTVNYLIKLHHPSNYICIARPNTNIDFSPSLILNKISKTHAKSQMIHLIH